MADVALRGPIRVLMLEDSALDAELNVAQLRRARLEFTFKQVWSREAFLAELATRAYDVILADHVLPGFDGDTALTLACEHAPEVPFIFVSGTLSEELAVQALKRGARDYVVKQRLQRLPDAILRAIRENEERSKLQAVERALKQSHDRLQLITASLPALIAHFSPEHRYLFANEAYQEWYGRTPASLIGEHPRTVVGAAFDEALPYLERVLAGERVNFELRVRAGTMPSRHAQVDCVPELDAHGAVIGYYAMARDISDLKHAEHSLRQANESLEQQVLERTAELQRSETRLQSIFESSFQYQILLDAQGQILDANLSSLAAILAGKEDVTGTLFWTSPWFAGTPEVADSIQAAVRRAAEGEASRGEHELRLPTGNRTFEFSFRPLWDLQRHVTAVVCEAVETTARRQAEEALRQSQKIEAVGQLTGGIAHDFNNILTVIAGNVEYAKLLTERLEDPQGSSTRALDSALKGVMRAANVTQRLLAFARRQPLANQPVDLNAQIGGMQDMLQRALGELVQLEIICTPDVWCVEIDPGQLEASVLNLAVNARDAMPEGGRLTIEVDNGHIDDDYAAQHPDVSAGQYATVRIRDSGHGMSSDTMARVFEPFFTTKEVGRGTGLGLSMVYGFAKQSGGHVVLESEPGSGTTVTLLFPRSNAPLPTARTTDAHSDNFYQPPEETTVLVAEDNDDVRAYTVETLRQLGYRVLEAHDGESALRLLDRPDVRVDLLFSDIVMPGMTGWELAQHVQQRKPGLRILFTSGYPRDMETRGKAGRKIAILAKPFTRSDLARSIRGALDLDTTEQRNGAA